MQEAGYEVKREQSDWTLSPDVTSLQRQLIEGWAEAAAAMAPDRGASIQSWKQRRLDHVGAGRSRLTVGHEDLAAWPRTRAKSRG